MRFVHQTLPQRVVFASGDSPAAVAREIEALGRSKVLLIASDREEAQAAPIMAQIPVVLRHDLPAGHRRADDLRGLGGDQRLGPDRADESRNPWSTPPTTLPLPVPAIR